MAKEKLTKTISSTHIVYECKRIGSSMGKDASQLYFLPPVPSWANVRASAGEQSTCGEQSSKSRKIVVSSVKDKYICCTNYYQVIFH